MNIYSTWTRSSLLCRVWESPEVSEYMLSLSFINVNQSTKAWEASWYCWWSCTFCSYCLICSCGRKRIGFYQHDLNSNISMLSNHIQDTVQCGMNFFNHIKIIYMYLSLSLTKSIETVISFFWARKYRNFWTSWTVKCTPFVFYLCCSSNMFISRANILDEKSHIWVVGRL